MARRIYGEDDPNTLMFLGNQANRLMELEEWDEAEAIYRNVIEGLAAAVGADHRWTLVTKATLAELLLDTKRPREARLLADAATEGLAKLYPPEHLYVIFASCLSAGAQATSDDAIGGAARLAELVRRATASLGPEHPQTLDARIYLARARGASGQWSEAEAILSDVADVRKRTLGDDHPDAVAVEQELAELRSRQKQTDTVSRDAGRLQPGSATGEPAPSMTSAMPGRAGG
jgi:hypothetical protein